MQIAVESTWQCISSQLTSEGWKLGWAQYEGADAESVWLAKAVRNGIVEEADGISLDEALDKLYCLTR